MAADCGSTSEFLITGQALLPRIAKYVRGASAVLVVGAGDSGLSALLARRLSREAEAGLISMDNDPLVVSRMKRRHPGLRWDVQDVTQMSYRDGQFDLLVDKSLLDWMIYTGRNQCRIVRMLAECGRVVAPGGKCLFLSWCPPAEMSVHLSCCRWLLGGVRCDELHARCDQAGRVPYDGGLLDPASPPKPGELRTKFYLYACTVLQAQPAVGLPAEQLAARGMFDRAIRAFVAELQAEPADPRRHEALAQCCMMMDEPDTVWLGLLAATRGVLLDSSWADGQLTLARARMACSQFGLAGESFDRAVELDPGLAGEVEQDRETAKRELERKMYSGGFQYFQWKHTECSPCM